MHMLVVTWGFLQYASPTITPSYSLLFNVLVWATYSFLYMALALLPAYLVARFARINSKLTAILAIVLSSAALLFMRADLMIFDLYNFHFNGFIWNLITTAGGVSSLGSGGDTYVSIALSVLLTIAIQCGLWLLGVKLAKNAKINMRWQYLAWLIAPMMLAQAVMYGVSDVKNYGPILSAAQAYPFYKKVTFRGLTEKMGIDRKSVV